MVGLVEEAAEVVWVSLEPRTGSLVDVYPRAVSVRLEGEYRALVSKGENGAVNVPLGAEFVVPGAVVSIVRSLEGSRVHTIAVQATTNGGLRKVRRHLLARGSRTVSVDVVETSTGSHEWEFHEEFLGLPSQGGDSKGSPKGKETTKAKGGVDAIMSDDGSGEPNHQLQIKRIERMVAEEDVVFCIEDFRG